MSAACLEKASDIAERALRGSTLGEIAGAAPATREQACSHRLRKRYKLIAE
jgi:hypothetical protein